MNDTTMMIIAPEPQHSGDVPVIVSHNAVPAMAPAGEAASLLAVISRAASDPSIDVTKMQQLMAMYKEIKADSAKAAFDDAFSAMQPELPTIDRNGAIIIEKNGAVIQRTPYARFEDINEAILPILGRHGFTLSFRYGTAADGRITVTGILSRNGHREETTMTLMHDSTGSKNGVQAIGSSYSYGKRYTTIALLNITSRAKQDVDDDGRAAGAPETISEEDAATLRDKLRLTGSNIAKFCEAYGIEKIEDLPASRLEAATNQLERKAAKKATPE